MRINLSSNTDILAVTPTLFGFVPTNSIVAIVLDNIGDRHTVHVSARYDIDEPLDAAAQLANTLPLQQPGGGMRRVLLIAIADSEHDKHAGDHLDAAQRHMTARGASIVKRLHTPHVEAGHTWTDIDTGDTGTTVDYRTSEVGLLMAVEHGRIVRATRDDIAGEFTPTEQAPAPDVDADAVEFVTHTVRGMSTAFEDPATLTPQLAANAGLLITANITHRDALLIVSTEHPQTGATVWTHLARQLRGRARIEALALAAACFYCSDDAVRAAIALEAAHHTAADAGQPDTTLVTLLDTAVQAALPPAKLRQLFAQLAAKPPAE
ncbi:hypothetical protein Y900_027705 [Mycolicibacterium aromaticivorans JS19b1 = JCM 16368]|uniref:DUF4192 domain-containing protein n=1 Tax=Mycolicibacterium aromaticivorans JS19b1 = JCM 16368 TaxID=1440774 RepID=A0A064CBM0_9MYCO|nr:DUF4192 domain-containing protein [Mycolicibacterium aromaticivorans]KDE97076.1 hypothetical protein Y900_027705 [Mycolicibacterium aromaticivorans JS19b1 = JCM 16368]